MMKNMIKKLLLFVLFVFSAFISMAQQDAMFSHYMFNTQAVNPGYVGSRQVLSVMSVYRTQWVGFDGAPNLSLIHI